MPIHDWTKVEAGIFHDFHGNWIQVLKHTLNAGLLPSSYYALTEQKAAGVGPDVLALEDKAEDDDSSPESSGGTGLLIAKPKAQLVEVTGPEFYRSKQRVVTVRHVTDDRVVAVIEIVSPGNKNNKNGIRSFLDKVCELKKKIHFLVIDLHPRGKHDPDGIHAAIWDDVWQGTAATVAEKPLTLASYECDDQVIAYVEPVAVGDVLPDMPLFLVPGGHVLVPLEKTYQTAWEGVPRRWRSVIDPAS